MGARDALPLSALPLPICQKADASARGCCRQMAAAARGELDSSGNVNSYLIAKIFLYIARKVTASQSLRQI